MIQIDDRYHGFPGLAMGGIAGSLVARQIGTEAEVTFQPPILTGEPLEIAETDDAVDLRMDDDVGATATATSVDIDVPDPVSWEDAEVASQSYRGHHDHPYPSCFTCGPDRAEGDGLQVFSAPVEDRPLEDDLALHVTVKLTVEYMHPTPLNRPVNLRAWIDGDLGRKTSVRCELGPEGDVTAVGNVIAARLENQR